MHLQLLVPRLEGGFYPHLFVFTLVEGVARPSHKPLQVVYCMVALQVYLSCTVLDVGQVHLCPVVVEDGAVARSITPLIEVGNADSSLTTAGIYHT